MYQYAEEQLTEELEEKKIIEKEIDSELKDVIRELENIIDYDSLRSETVSIVLTIAAIIIGVSSGVAAIGLIWKVSALGAKLLGIVIGVISGGCFVYVKKGIEWVLDSTKKIRNLKRQGIKESKKQQNELFEKKVKLGKEKDNVQREINKINTNLDQIKIYQRIMNDPFYLADTQEEYELLTGKRQVLDEFLNERINYSNVHLEVKEIESTNVKKLIKKI